MSAKLHLEPMDIDDTAQDIRVRFLQEHRYPIRQSRPQFDAHVAAWEHSESPIRSAWWAEYYEREYDRRHKF